MTDHNQDTEKPFDATPQKLRKAREQGDVIRSMDVFAASGYFGFLAACLLTGAWSIQHLGQFLQSFLGQADRLAPLYFEGPASSLVATTLSTTAAGASPFLLIPSVFVLLSIIAQRALVFSPGKLMMKASRISVIENAKNKFGRSGLFEFLKSSFKMLIFIFVLGLFFIERLDQIVGSPQSSWGASVTLIANLCMEFLFIVFAIAATIGAADWAWQYVEHLRKNKMSRKEVLDETKDIEGDPYLKSARRQKGQSLASNRMLADVPLSDVIIVNPTHYAIALQWSRKPGSAPCCVAKGVDETASVIRRIAIENKVPIHHDAPTARILFATVEIGSEILEDQYRAVAVAIQFAEKARTRAKAQPL